MTQIPPGPWSAPSAAVYAADGQMVCSLGNADVVKAYRKRGDGNGAMLMNTAHLIAATPVMLEALRTIASQSIGDDWTAEQAIQFVKQYACEVVAKATPRKEANNG